MQIIAVQVYLANEWQFCIAKSPKYFRRQIHVYQLYGRHSPPPLISLLISFPDRALLVM